MELQMSFGVALVSEFDETVTTIALLPGIVLTLGSDVSRAQ